MTKIIIIENQYTQFKEIRRHLCNSGFEVFPPENQIEFKDFIDLVRIFLNKRYGGIESNSDRAKAFEEIISIIEAEKPEVIIIDNILVGYHNPENGIFLAKQFRDKEINQPIIFLTRSEQYSSDSMKNLPEVSGIKHWVPKGYKGGEILDEDYLKEYLIKPINKSLEDFNKAGTHNEINKEGESISGFSGRLIAPERISEIAEATSTALSHNNLLYNEQLRNFFGEGFKNHLSKLPTGQTPDLQLRQDLTNFNNVGRLMDETVPLEIWLRNAIKYLELYKEAAVLKEALNEVRKQLSELPS